LGKTIYKTNSFFSRKHSFYSSYLFKASKFLSLRFIKGFENSYSIVSSNSNLHIGRCPQPRPETRTRRWINLLWSLTYLQQQLLKIWCRLSRAHVGMITSHLWLSPKSVDELTLFLHGLALFAVVWDQVLSSWLVLFRPATRSCRLREHLNSYLFEDLIFPGCRD
jgi:hypothetical protein